MNSLVIGMGEIGTALARILGDKYIVKTYDTKTDDALHPPMDCEIIHICIPYSEKFVEIVESYITSTQCKYCVIHSTVPVGTCEEIKGAIVFHSPMRGVHPYMEKGMLSYVKYISYNHANHYKDVLIVGKYFELCGIEIDICFKYKITELMKLLELSRYGTYIAFAKEQESICKHFGVCYEDVVNNYENTRNAGLIKLGNPELCQPLLYPFDNFVGGHCTVEDMELLLSQIETPLLKMAHQIDKNTKIWGNCNIYPTAKIGKGCSIGQFCEIGNNVVIGNNVRIGAYCFIPEGVVIEDDCFIAPRVSFSNDKHPPSNKECWGNITIKKGAVIGMGAIILPCVTVGEKAVIGAGAVVTKDVPAGEVWFGNAAYSRGQRDVIYAK